MPTDVISIGLNCCNNPWNAGFLAKSRLERFCQTFYGTLTEPTQQRAVREKESAQDYGDGKYIATVGNRIEKRFLEVTTKLNHFPVMATGTEPTPPATECQDELMIAIGAFDTGEPFAQIAACVIFSDDRGDDRPVKAVVLLEKIVMALVKLEKAVIKELPQQGLRWLSSPEYIHLSAAFHMAPLLPARG